MKNIVKYPLLSWLADQFFSRFRAQSFRENSKVLTSLLGELKQGKDVLQLNIESEDRVYSAQVEAFVMDHNMLVLGDIMPRSRLAALKRGGKCRLSIFGDANGISIPCDYLEPLVSCPAWMNHTQRFHQFYIKASKFSLSDQVFLKFLAGNRLTNNGGSEHCVLADNSAVGSKVA